MEVSVGRIAVLLAANTRFAIANSCRYGMAPACSEQTKNTVIPLAEDERCWPVVPPLFAAVSRHATLSARRASNSRCIGPVTGAAFPV
jgi:hypothetical protein